MEKRIRESFHLAQKTIVGGGRGKKKASQKKAVSLHKDKEKYLGGVEGRRGGPKGVFLRLNKQHQRVLERDEKEIFTRGKEFDRKKNEKTVGRKNKICSECKASREKTEQEAVRGEGMPLKTGKVRPGIAQYS